MNFLQSLWHAHDWCIEESFKDLKDLRAGFKLKGKVTKNPRRLLKLLMIGAIGYLFCNAAGLYGETHNLHRDFQVSSRKQRENALWRIGHILVTRGMVSAEAILAAISELPVDFAGDANVKAA